ncbi:MAG TPA: 3,4-dehydroadipyl-CoA semialdehyde dehydrogenase [Myxococcota bacterium]|jgi:oxepin-CoA hydrolase/3-oxo-5,6-dehydrosuberyl-CoA semialdehyde dehydrogenase|nr:3,4-dehydroadipyl-CoA semialdehyde dehydrogenase [Myxococcota bacterium]
MKTLSSYVEGRWVEGRGDGALLVNPATEEPLARAGTEGVDFAGALRYARDVGGPRLRAMTFAERGAMLRALARAIHAGRDELIALSIANGGNTRSDAKFDVDGAAGTIAAYADLGESLGAVRHLVDGEAVQLARSPAFVGRHVLVPRPGVAVHVNAFNFPAWGLAEKAAVALLAGMPVVSKPATSTALLAHRLVELLVASGALPEGALSFLAGGAGDLVEHLGPQDVLAFTGSSDTGARLRGHPRVIAQAVRVNVEADSLNAAVLGPDVDADAETYALFIKDVVRDVTQKAGQKCTAIRRVLVPEAMRARVRDELVARLAGVVVGDPAQESVRMGPLATAQQLRDVRAGIERLAAQAPPVHGSAARVGERGYFVGTVLLEVAAGGDAPEVHRHEVFGPAATLLGYSGDAAAAVALVGRAEGGLVSSVYSDDRAFTGEMLFGLAPWHGRLMLGSKKIVEHSTGPGTVLPWLVHGGPGRAGGGEELGGPRGLALYLQRTAVQGARAVLDALLDPKAPAAGGAS